MATAKKTVKKTTEVYALKDTYQEITNAVIEQLEKGVIPWKKPWKQSSSDGSFIPMNASTDNNYKGWNIFWLNMHAQINGYSSSRYITFKQAIDLKGNVKKGEKGTQIVKWVPLTGKDKTEAPVSEMAPKAGDLKSGYAKGILKVHTVFNIDQCEGLNFPALIVLEKSELQKNEACERIIEEMPNRPNLTTGENLAYYRPSTDTVNMPVMNTFLSPEGYYSTFFHELGHSTGAEKRLNRKELVESDGFGKTNYAKEELTAELTAAFLSGYTGIGQMIIDNTASYIQNWLDALKNDKTLLISAASRAEKAANFILGNLVEEQKKAA